MSAFFGVVVEFAYGGHDSGRVHFMDLYGPAKAGQQSHRELSAEMFAKFLQSG